MGGTIAARKEDKNQRILFISDLHAPYQHPDSLNFLIAIKKKYKPTRVICMGDEVDSHAMSYHEKEPEAYGAGCELDKSRKFLKKLEKTFPEMDIISSNHGSLFQRKAKTAGIPPEYLKTENEIYNVSDLWRWYPDMTIELPNGHSVYVHHGMGANNLNASQSIGMSLVTGHHHTVMNIQYWKTKQDINFAMSCGCLIDRESLAMRYAKDGKKEQVIGTGMIIDNNPMLIPMRMKNRRWTGEL